MFLLGTWVSSLHPFKLFFLPAKPSSTNLEPKVTVYSLKMSVFISISLNISNELKLGCKWSEAEQFTLGLQKLALEVLYFLS